MGLAERIGELGPFELLTRGDELPVFAFTTKSGISTLNVFDVWRRLRERGWLVPAYTFPENRQDLSLVRAVVRNGFSRDLASLFVEDVSRLLPEPKRQSGPLQGPRRPPRSTTDAPAPAQDGTHDKPQQFTSATGESDRHGRGRPSRQRQFGNSRGPPGINTQFRATGSGR
jgi:hypothetical protein